MYKIAIDGPGGAGKSSVAKAIAKELGIVYVDTGALYRSIGLYMVNHGIDTKDEPAVIGELGKFTLELIFRDGKQIILLDGVDVGDKIRTPEISMAASNVSAIGAVREYLLNTQRSIAKTSCVIMDGRDIGTVIFPEAEVKIFLTASSEARAKRRYDELIARGSDVTYEKVLAEMIERDTNDSTRKIAPCVAAADAVTVDNTELNEEETVRKITEIIKERIPYINDLPRKDSTYMKWHKRVHKLVRLLFGLKITGLENVPENGGIMFCSNHIAARDAVIIAAACEREIKFLAKKELFSVPLIGRVIRALGAVKLDRGGSDVSAIRTSINLIKSGYALSVFPQGHRYPGVNPGTTPRKNGAAMICYHAMCDVVPVCIKVRGFKYGIFKKTEVIFGKPIPYADLQLKSGGSEEYRSATDKIFERIVSLGGYDALPAPSETEIKN